MTHFRPLIKKLAWQCGPFIIDFIAQRIGGKINIVCIYIPFAFTPGTPGGSLASLVTSLMQYPMSDTLGEITVFLPKCVISTWVRNTIQQVTDNPTLLYHIPHGSLLHLGNHTL